VGKLLKRSGDMKKIIAMLLVLFFLTGNAFAGPGVGPQGGVASQEQSKLDAKLLTKEN